ncbi:hypothetical protein O181_042817 [Austropuccinia psidii MF-1]|uniref:Integrase catalytic domain-containing protein n=1 Tax=Austropuccinia psidii MF-1 TaxID=1389203 RepID=A0A9Q3DNK1_9BASI|nr:hypothetical protein [Austropuccinia psidii MF-1]
MQFVYLLSTKSECFKYSVKFQNLVENLKGRTIKTVISDNGGEFVNSKFKHILNTKGICHLPTAPYTPQQNPVAERGDQLLLQRVWVMMLDNKVPSKWWGEASAMAVFILNRTPFSTLNFVAPLKENCPGNTSASPQVSPIIDTASPSSNLQIPFEADFSAPTFPEQPNSTSFLSKGNNNPFPKGLNYNFVPVEAPQNVNSRISNSNILTGGQMCRLPSCFEGVVINEAPVSFKEAMASSKSGGLLVAIKN